MATRQTMRPVIFRNFLKEMLDSLSVRPADALMAFDLKVILFTASPVPIPTVGLTYAELIQPTFTGYTVPNFSDWNAVHITLPGGAGIGNALNAVFLCEDDASADVATGYALIGAANQLYMAELFDEPVPFGELGSYLDLFVIFPLEFSPNVDSGF